MMHSHSALQRRLAALACLLVAAVLTGCARAPLAEHQASLESIQTVRQAPMAPVNVGNFALAPGKSAAIDQSVSARGVTLVSPFQDSYARYLREALVTELKAAGKFDANAATQVSGWLTANDLDASGIARGLGSLGAIFVVQRDGRELYRRELVEDAQWPSSFIGIEAVSLAVNQYGLLYRKLILRLVGDSDFQAATAPR